METKCQPMIQIWIDTEQKIASFHEVAGLNPFCCYSCEQFMSYTFALTEEGFRFM